MSLIKKNLAISGFSEKCSGTYENYDFYASDNASKDTPDIIILARNAPNKSITIFYPSDEEIAKNYVQAVRQQLSRIRKAVRAANKPIAAFNLSFFYEKGLNNGTKITLQITMNENINEVVKALGEFDEKIKL